MFVFDGYKLHSFKKRRYNFQNGVGRVKKHRSSENTRQKSVQIKFRIIDLEISPDYAIGAKRH